MPWQARSDEYRREAKALHEAAAAATDTSLRRHYEAIALEYERLAQAAEQMAAPWRKLFGPAGNDRK